MKPALVKVARGQRADDPTNLWLIDPVARLLVPAAVRIGISANMVSVSGLFIGAAAALADERWRQPGWAALGLLISMAWLLTDSLDGMVARATDTCSAFGRELDGLCDHGVFALIYIALARSVGGVAVWSLMLGAAAAHAVQASLYEAERARFRRRLQGDPGSPPDDAPRNVASRLYSRVACSFDRAASPFDRLLGCSASSGALRARYGQAAAPVFSTMLPLSQNMRIIAIFLACLYGRIATFFWYELVPLSILTAAGALWHRRIEQKLGMLARAPLVDDAGGLIPLGKA